MHVIIYESVAEVLLRDEDHRTESESREVPDSRTWEDDGMDHAVLRLQFVPYKVSVLT